MSTPLKITEGKVTNKKSDTVQITNRGEGEGRDRGET